MDLKFFEKTAADVRVGVIKAVSAAAPAIREDRFRQRIS